MPELSLELAQALKEVGFPQQGTNKCWSKAGDENVCWDSSTLWSKDYNKIAAPNSDEIETQIQKEFPYKRIIIKSFENLTSYAIWLEYDYGFERAEGKSIIECLAKIYIKLKQLQAKETV